MCVFCCVLIFCIFFFFKQKTAYDMRISDWSSDVCSSDLREDDLGREPLGKVPLSAVAMERKGTSTERGDEQRAVRARNQERRELTQQLREISARIAETMRNLGDKAKGMAQGLRDRLGSA